MRLSLNTIRFVYKVNMSAGSDRSLRPPEQAQEVEVTERQRSHPRITLRDFFTYLGPTLIVSLAYIDPGNFGTDIAGGSQFNYGTDLGGLDGERDGDDALQYLSGKLGLATGNGSRAATPGLAEDQSRG
jgi:hypothetical protein